MAIVGEKGVGSDMGHFRTFQIYRLAITPDSPIIDKSFCKQFGIVDAGSCSMNLSEKWIYVQKFPKRINDTRLRYLLVRSYTSRSEFQVRNDESISKNAYFYSSNLKKV